MFSDDANFAEGDATHQLLTETVTEVSTDLSMHTFTDIKQGEQLV